MPTTPRHCSVTGCERLFHSAWTKHGPHQGRDFCKLHYDRLVRGNDIGPVDPLIDFAHAAPRRASEAPLCSVQPCPAQAKRRGMCDTHYQRWLKYGDPNTVKSRRVNEGNCSVTLPTGKPCPDDAYVRGMCSTHYQRWKTHGDPLHEVERVNGAATCSEPGCTNKPKSRGLCSRDYERQRVAKLKG